MTASVALGVAGFTFVKYEEQQEILDRMQSERPSVAAPAQPASVSSPPPSRPPDPMPSADLGVASMSDVVARVLPAVVNIATARRGPLPGPMGAPQGGRGADSLGSGVIVSADGLVLTNHHVIGNGGAILVTLSDGREFPASIVGTDPQTDMALLRLESVRGEITPIPYGDSSRLRQGDVVLAIGNPFGVGQTVTMGIVSAIGRANMGIAEYEDFIQTDAAINPGNSGGALISMSGELVGINTAILSRTGGNHGIGFAIPSNMLRPIVDSLLRHGKVVRGWLGVTIQDLTPELASAMQFSSSRGVLVTAVEPGSPAESAGVRAGDLIEELDREQLRSSAQFRNLIATRGATAQIDLVIVRSSERQTLPVTLAERPAVPLEALPPPTSNQPSRQAPAWPFGLPPGVGPFVEPAPEPLPRTLRGQEVGGLQVVDLDARIRSALRIPPDIRNGAVIVGARPGSPGEATGLMQGDVIVEVNRTPVTGAAQFAHEYARAGGNAVVLVRRGQGSLYVLMR
jgi:serine protease Do